MTCWPSGVSDGLSAFAPRGIASVEKAVTIFGKIQS